MLAPDAEVPDHPDGLGRVLDPESLINGLEPHLREGRFVHDGREALRDRVAEEAKEFAVPLGRFGRCVCVGRRGHGYSSPRG